MKRTKAKNFAQVHRFGDCVAVYVGDGSTVYLTPSDARKLAKALNACAKDVKANTFSDSLFATFRLDAENTGYNGVEYRVDRVPKD